MRSRPLLAGIRALARPAVAVALLLGPLLACQGALDEFGLGGIPSQELSEQPIAISYHTPEEARKRAEAYDAMREHAADAANEVAPVRPSRGGYADLVASQENVTEFFDHLLGVSRQQDDRFPGRLALLDPRTGKVAVVAAALRGSIPLAWSSDHRRLLFAQPEGYDFQIHEYDAVDATERTVTLGPPAHTQACYGPDGRIVVAVVDTLATPVRSYIAVSGPGGRRPFQHLTEGPSDHSPTCRENSDRVVFVREDQPPRADLYVVGLEPGSEPQRLSPGRPPSLSHDGQWVVFAAPMKRELRIWRIRPDGTGRAPVGHGIRHEARPELSPDGTAVVYVASEQMPRRQLYVRRFDGTGDRILFADGDGEYPVW